MSVNGIPSEAQPQLQYFHPVLREYYQSVRDAFMPDDFSASQQAFAQLRKSSQTSTAGQIGEPAANIGQGLQDAGKVPEGGSTSIPAHATDELQQHIQLMSEKQAQTQDTTANEPSGSSGDGSNSEIGANVNVSV